jgi:hypothetical protein
VSFLIELIGPLIKFVILALFEVQEKKDEAIQAGDIADGASTDLFDRDLL